MIAMFKKEMLEISRTRKLLILGIIFLFVAVSSPIIAKLLPTIFKTIQTEGIIFNLPDPTWRDAVDQFVKNISQIAMIVIVFIFAGSIAEEKNKKTLELLLTKPVSRTNFILSKYLAAFIVTTILYAIGALIFYGYTASIFDGFGFANFSVMALFILIYLLQVVALTIFASVFTSNQIIAAGIAFFIEIIAVTILGAIDKIAKYTPGYILSRYRDVAEGNYGDIWPSVVTTLVIIVISIILAVLSFRRQEVER